METAKEFLAREAELHRKTLARKPGSYRRLNPSTYYVKWYDLVWVITKLGSDSWTWMRYDQAKGNDIFRTYADCKLALENYLLDLTFGDNSREGVPLTW